MCGIAGIMVPRGKAADAGVLAAMRRALAHRGPDGHGEWVKDNVALAHLRLAIIDLETGDQPLTDAAGAALIANGEIYNYRELRTELPGASLRTRSDCEPPLLLYRRHGLDFVERLRGMYAIAIHDPAAGRLVLVRDPFGIKPLYYAETPKGFVFASEPQALIASGLVAPRLDPAARAELLQRQFVSGGDTIFLGIKRVLPGETLAVENGRIVERRRRAALPAGGPVERSEGEALAALDAALTDSVEMHQRSDVPYGMFLSGGIDSSAVLALMARLNDRPVRAFTAYFPDTAAADERAQARAVAAALGAEHVEVEFSERDFLALLPAVAASLDDPTADYATLPTYKLAQVAGRELKVVLSGEGGDELFAGYGRYRRLVRWWIPEKRARGAFDGLGVLRDETWPERRDQDVRAWPNRLDDLAETKSGPYRRDDPDRRTAVQDAQAADCASWLPNDLLIKLDRCLMAHGVEGRTPFLDPVVAELAFRLPDALKIRRGLGKWILRRWVGDKLPAVQPMAPKQGFTVPVGEWVAAHGARLGPLVARAPGIDELCRPGTIEPLFREGGRRAGFAAWTLLFYALWHRRHVLGKAPAGDIFETLSEGS
jgi:asparagine synthase (glutamine-hydrolysing)